MSSRPTQVHTQFDGAAVQIFAANERINQLLIERLDPALWQARPPGKTRTIAAIFTHMHNVRTKWVRLSVPQLSVPAQLKRSQCTPARASAALAGSAACCEQLLAQALGDDNRVTQFHRDGWAKPWPAGPQMLCYMIAHEAHHRGQVCMLAHQLGSPLPTDVTARMWSWEKL